MELLLERMPTYQEGKDLGVIMRRNAQGAPRTEIWTLRNFAPEMLMFAPYSTELKDRLYTHNASVHVGLAKGAMPENGLLALDGRSKGQLWHQNLAKHIHNATGCLFWAIERTSEVSQANLSMDFCELSAPEVTLHVPGLEKKSVKFSKSTFPQVPVLVNRAAVPRHTRLLALEDKMIVRAREEETKRKREEHSAQEQANKRGRPGST